MRALQSAASTVRAGLSLEGYTIGHLGAGEALGYTLPSALAPLGLRPAPVSQPWVRAVCEACAKPGVGCSRALACGPAGVHARPSARLPVAET